MGERREIRPAPLTISSPFSFSPLQDLCMTAEERAIESEEEKGTERGEEHTLSRDVGEMDRKREV